MNAGVCGAGASSAVSGLAGGGDRDEELGASELLLMSLWLPPAGVRDGGAAALSTDGTGALTPIGGVGGARGGSHELVTVAPCR